MARLEAKKILLNIENYHIFKNEKNTVNVRKTETGGYAVLLWPRNNFYRNNWNFGSSVLWALAQLESYGFIED